MVNSQTSQIHRSLSIFLIFTREHLTRSSDVGLFSVITEECRESAVAGYRFWLGLGVTSPCPRCSSHNPARLTTRTTLQPVHASKGGAVGDVLMSARHGESGWHHRSLAAERCAIAFVRSSTMGRFRHYDARAVAACVRQDPRICGLTAWASPSRGWQAHLESAVQS